MSSLDEALATILNNATGLTALIGSAGVYPDPAGQDAVYPFVTYDVMSMTEGFSMQGSSGLLQPMYTFKAWARTKKQASAVIAQVRLAICGYRGISNGVTIGAIVPRNEDDDFDAKAKAYWRSQDYEVLYNDVIPTF